MDTQASQVQSQPTCWGFEAASARVGVSQHLLRRLATAGVLRTIYIAGRRLIPLAEIERIETQGIGDGRKAGWKRPKAGR
jgi:hypothetical protein